MTEHKFNAVIEGCFNDAWNNHHYKLAQLDIPSNISYLRDGVYIYKLYANTTDFKEIAETNGNLEDLEANILSLSSCKGVIVSAWIGKDNHLSRPRAIFLRDGRIFLEEVLYNNKSYTQTINSSLEFAKQTFSRHYYYKFNPGRSENNGR